MSRPCLASLRHKTWWPPLEAEVARQGAEVSGVVTGGRHVQLEIARAGKVVLAFPISLGGNVGKHLPAAMLRKRLRVIEGRRP